MKALFSTLIIMVLTLQLGSAAILSGNEDEAIIKWKKTTIDLGEIKMNKPAPATFVFNNTGRILMDEKYSLEEGSKINLNLTAFPKGVYHLVLAHQEFNVSKKLVKL